LKLKRQNEDWLSSAQAYVIKAMELGLVNSDKDIYQLLPNYLKYLENAWLFQPLVLRHTLCLPR
ncbi:hypothetical protein B2J67_02635, partial [Vibrio cholerae]